MITYFLCLFGVSLLAAIGNSSRVRKIYRGDCEARWVPSKASVAVIFCIFCFLYAFRWRVGTDFMGYYYSYNIYGQSSIKELIGERDWGFSVLSAAVYHLSNGNFQLYNLVLAIITYAPIMYVYRRYSGDFCLTVFLYMTTLACFWPYNGVRQSLAGSICFGAFSYLCNKKYLKYVVCILIASVCHSTALIMFPLMFFLLMKPWNRAMLLVTTGILLSILFLGNLWGYVIGLLDVLGQEKMVSDYGNTIISSNGVNSLRIIVALLPVLLSFMLHKYGLDADDRAIQILENMVVLGALFMIAASRLTVLARFGAYFSFAPPLMYARFKGLFTEQTSKLFVAIVMVCYIAYFAMLLPVESNLVPYQFYFYR